MTTPATVSTVQSTVQNIVSGSTTTSSLQDAEHQFAKPAGPLGASDKTTVPFWTQVDAGLKGDHYTTAQAHDAVRAAQLLANDSGGRDIGEISDLIARNQALDPGAVTAAVNDFIKQTGLSAGDFFMGLEDDLEGINGLSASDAISKATAAQVPYSSSTAGG